MNDIALLKLFADRETYTRYHSYINYDILEPEIRLLLKAYNKYYKEYKDKNIINLDDFQLYFCHYCLPDMTRSEKQTYDLLLGRAKEEEFPEVKDMLLKSYQEKKLKYDLQQAIDGNFNHERAQQLIDKYKEICLTLEAEEEEGFVPNDISSILEQTERTGGLQWRLKCLNESLGGLIQGDFGIVAAYVDTGKSTFAASEATHMATQIEDGCVLWLNNEEFNYRVQKRLWMATLGCPWDKIIKYQDKAIKKYKKMMHGDINRIKLFDIRGFSIDKVDQLVRKYNPKLIIIDQVDKINCKTKSNWQEHDRLKHLYGKVRDIANTICPVIGISQADATTRWKDGRTGNMVYQKYLDQSQLDGSKVGKNGEADFIIMIGKDVEYPNIRGISIPKNKLKGDSLRTEVIFKGDVARYED